MFIGICGASGSGKSTLAYELEKRVQVQTLVINQDAYYLDHGHLSFEARAQLNYDHPDIFDHDLLLADARRLLQGSPITRKHYDYALHRRADEGSLLSPAPLMIIEGIHAFHDERLRALFDLMLYIHVDPDICLLRRIQRDINQRGRQIDGIAHQYTTTVKPMFETYIRNYMRHADVIIAKGGRNARIVDLIAGYINDTLKEQHEA